MDLTVPDAAPVRDFYRDVVGWTAAEVDMGGYQDYTMAAGDDPVAGVCHARGGNADVPPVWLVYFTVAELDESLRRCAAAGAKYGRRRAPPVGWGATPSSRIRPARCPLVSVGVTGRLEILQQSVRVRRLGRPHQRDEGQRGQTGRQ